LSLVIGDAIDARKLTMIDLVRAKVVWVFRRHRKKQLAEIQKGESSKEFFYGFLTLRNRFQAQFIEDARSNLLWIFWYPIERVLSKRMGMGFALHIPLWQWRTLRSADVIIATNDACGLPIALLKRWGFLRGRLLYISQGLSDRIDFYGKQKALSRFYHQLLRQSVDQLVVLSEGARRGLAQWLEMAEDGIELLPFGTDLEFWHQTAVPGTNRILSIGSDPGRDYGTLLSATQWPLHIITSQRLPGAPNQNVTQSTQHPSVELRDLFSGARFVVIPLHDRDQPSGQSAGLQAMACGKALILTRTRGWWGETSLVDGENCLQVPPGDIPALRRAIERLWNDPALCERLGNQARKTVEDHFSESRMAESLGAIIAQQLQNS
jgi:glycosyltransferase involved in cell wall biosynthesis